MKRLLYGCAMGLALNSLVLAQDLPIRERRVFAFSEGGSVRLQLSSGDYTIRAGQRDRVVIQWKANSPEDEKDMKKIKVGATVKGNAASLRTESPTKHARLVIEIPARSDLYLRMRAGDVSISGIDGNKDIHVTAGDLKIDVPPASYSHVHASVTFGDLQATPLGISQDGIARSFDWNGTGKYTLRATLFAGDLTLGPEHTH